MSKLISIIIPTRNEEKNLSRCLESIVGNGFASYEVIVVDQSSTDQTITIARQFNTKIISTKPTKKYIPPSKSRNLGFKESTGNYIYHLDADMELQPGLLAEIVDILKNPAISAVIIPEKDIPANFWAKGKALERSFYFNTPMEAARVSRREVFAKTGYDKVISSGEDWHIHQQFTNLGHIGRTQKCVFHHIGNVSLLKEFGKKRHYGYGAGSFVSGNKTQLLTLFIILLWIYVKGFVTNIFIHPLSLVSFIIVRTTDVLGLFLGLFNSKNA